MAGLIRVGGEWKPTDLVVSKNLVSTLTDRLRQQTMVLRRTKTAGARERRMDIIADLQAQLATARSNYDATKNYFKSAEGTADVQASYARLPSNVYGNLDKNAIAKPADTMTANVPANNILGGIAAGGMGIVLLVLLALGLRK